MRYLQKGAQNTPFSGLPCLFLCIYRRPPPYPHFYIFRVWPFNGLERVSYIEKYFVKKILLFKSLVICFFVTLAMHRMINLNAQRHIIYIVLKFIARDIILAMKYGLYLTFLYILVISSLRITQRDVMAVLYISARAAWSRPAFLVSVQSCFQISWQEKVPHPSLFPFCSFCLVERSFPNLSRSRLEHRES